MTVYYTITCEDCSDTLLVSDRRVDAICTRCSDNYTECYSCEETRHNDDMRYSFLSGNTYCESCYNDRYTCCTDCDTEIRLDDSIDGYCEDCAPNDDGCCRIKPYRYDRPDYLFKKLGNGPWYGLELEVYRRDLCMDDTVNTVLDSLNKDVTALWVAKEDSSLSSGGFELESLPMSKEYIQESLDKLEGHRDILKAFHGYNNGLHVNCDTPEGRIHRAKLISFMNEESNVPLFETVGQRELNNYCSPSFVPKRRYIQKEKPYTSRNTIYMDDTRTEFRIFKANLKKDRINKAIDFCQAVIDFAGACSLKDMTSDPFLKFVWENKHLYPDLMIFLLSRIPDGFTIADVPKRHLDDFKERLRRGEDKQGAKKYGLCVVNY